MRAESGAGQCRVAGLGLVLADDPGDPAAAELAAVLAGEQRVVVVAGPVEAMLGQVGAQQRGGVAAERDVADLAAFAGQHGQRRGLHADVAHGEPGEFGSPGGAVVEGGQQVASRRPRRVDRSGAASRRRACPAVRWFTPGRAVFLAGTARMSWQPAIRAGSCDCSQRKNELSPASRWLRVEMLLCRSVSSQSRNLVMAAASMRSRVSLSGGMDLTSPKKAISSRS